MTEMVQKMLKQYIHISRFPPAIKLMPHAQTHLSLKEINPALK